MRPCSSRSFVIEVRVGHVIEVQRNTLQHPRIDDRTRASRGVRDRCNKYAAFAAKQEISSLLCKAIMPNLGGVANVERDFPGRVRSAGDPVTPTERAVVVPQRPMRRIDVGSINHFNDTAVASTLILVHVTPNRFSGSSTVISYLLQPAPQKRLLATDC
jgi:hypothetical protein